MGDVTSYDPVDYLNRLEAEVERLNVDLDHEAREHVVTHERWMDAKAEVDRLRENIDVALGALSRLEADMASTWGGELPAPLERALGALHG